MLRLIGMFIFYCGILLSHTAICSEFDESAKWHVTKILKSHCLEDSIVGSSLQDGFRTLSPELLTGIAKSFYLLNKCYPKLLNKGSYLEFGLYRGFSFWFAQQVGNDFVEKDFNYFGFDSFAGLPDQSQDYSSTGGGWQPSLYSASIKEVTNYLYQHGSDFSKLHLVKGWYSQQLFADWMKQFSSIKPSIITIDADVFESCREILNFFESYFQPGTVILFDDFINKAHSAKINNYSERKALIEFLLEHENIQLIHLFPFGWHGYAFMVTSCNGAYLDDAIKKKVQSLIGEPELPDYPAF